MASDSVVVIDDDLSGIGVSASATQAASSQFNLATFADVDDSTLTAASFAATVDWGDGTTSAGTVSGTSGNFTVSGSHTYGDGGAFRVRVAVSEIAAGSTPTTTINGLINVPDTDTLAATGAASFSTSEGNPTAVVLGTFSDSNASTPARDFVATIDWGNGTTSAGTITGSAGQFTVTAPSKRVEQLPCDSTGSIPMKDHTYGPWRRGDVTTCRSVKVGRELQNDLSRLVRRAIRDIGGFRTGGVHANGLFSPPRGEAAASPSS
jgi:hypothetical protein